MTCVVDKRFNLAVYRYPLAKTKKQLEAFSADLGRWLDWYEAVSTDKGQEP